MHRLSGGTGGIRTHNRCILTQTSTKLIHCTRQHSFTSRYIVRIHRRAALTAWLPRHICPRLSEVSSPCLAAMLTRAGKRVWFSMALANQKPNRLFLKLPLSFSLRYGSHDSCLTVTSNDFFKILSTRPI